MNDVISKVKISDQKLKRLKQGKLNELTKKLKEKD